MNLSTLRDIRLAVHFGLRFGDLSVSNARKVLDMAKTPEPDDRSAGLLSGGIIEIIRGDECELEYRNHDMSAAAWGAVHAFEDGWVKRAKVRGLEITPAGRARLSAKP